MNKLVAVNGCFDRLHAGHLHLLRRAASLGDVFAFINSHEFIRETKGPGRPFEKESVRAANLLNTGLVKHVEIFDSEGCLAWWFKILKPNYLVKGDDYKNKPITGAEFVGEIVFVPRIPDISTTELNTKLA